MTQTDFEAQDAARTLAAQADAEALSPTLSTEAKSFSRRARAKAKEGAELLRTKAQDGAEAVKTQALAVRDKAAANPKKTALIGAAVTGALLSAGAVLWVALSDTRRSRAYDAFRSLKTSALRR